MGVNLGP